VLTILEPITLPYIQCTFYDYREPEESRTFHCPLGSFVTSELKYPALQIYLCQNTLKYHNPQSGLINVKYNKIKQKNLLLITVRSLTILKPRMSLNV